MVIEKNDNTRDGFVFFVLHSIAKLIVMGRVYYAEF